MKILNVNELSTLSIKVTEEIEEKNLHIFLRTSIRNSNLPYSKECYYYFYYNSNNLTYEIIFYEKLSNSALLEPFILVQQYASIEDSIQVITTKSYFIVTRNHKLLILKKVNKIDKEEISLYIQQIYKIIDFNIVEVSEEYLNKLEFKENNFNLNYDYPLYPKKSFYYFILFVISSLFILFLMIYIDYKNTERLPTPKNHVQIIEKDSNHDKIIENMVGLFKYIKLNDILIDKVSYTNNKFKTTLYHKHQSSLLKLADIYKKTMHLKSLKYNEIKNTYEMEIIVEY